MTAIANPPMLDHGSPQRVRWRTRSWVTVVIVVFIGPPVDWPPTGLRPVQAVVEALIDAATHVRVHRVEIPAVTESTVVDVDLPDPRVVLELGQV